MTQILQIQDHASKINSDMQKVIMLNVNLMPNDNEGKENALELSKMTVVI